MPDDFDPREFIVQNHILIKTDEVWICDVLEGEGYRVSHIEKHPADDHILVEFKDNTPQLPFLEDDEVEDEDYDEYMHNKLEPLLLKHVPRGKTLSYFETGISFGRHYRLWFKLSPVKQS